MTPIEYYKIQIKEQNFEEDAAQADIIKQFNELYLKLIEPTDLFTNLKK